MGAMQAASMFFFLAVFAMLTTVWTLFSGILSMTQDQGHDPRRSERLMFTRVGLQTAAAALVLIGMLSEPDKKSAGRRAKERATHGPEKSQCVGGGHANPQGLDEPDYRRSER